MWLLQYLGSKRNNLALGGFEPGSVFVIEYNIQRDKWSLLAFVHWPIVYLVNQYPPMEKEKDKKKRKDSTKAVDEIHLQFVFFKRI